MTWDWCADRLSLEREKFKTAEPQPRISLRDTTSNFKFPILIPGSLFLASLWQRSSVSSLSQSLEWGNQGREKGMWASFCALYKLKQIFVTSKTWARHPRRFHTYKGDPFFLPSPHPPSEIEIIRLNVTLNVRQSILIEMREVSNNEMSAVLFSLSQKLVNTHFVNIK